jgi:hypothetical protein
LTKPKDTATALRTGSIKVDTSASPKMPLRPLAALPRRKMQPLPVQYYLPIFYSFHIPKFNLVAPEASTPVATPKPPVAANTGNRPPAIKKETDAPVQVETEDAAETTVEVYFTDGHGKFYTAAPLIYCADAASGKKAAEFFRMVGANGHPEAQRLPAGTYDLGLSNNNKILKHGIVIADKKTNKIIVTVSNGNIAFAYEGNPTRPVIEYEAQIDILFEQGAKVKQKCSELLDYPPGNYHIIVNTLPISHFNSDVLFGSQTVITLKEPGFLQVINADKAGILMLYYEKSPNRFERFYEMDITGDPDKQKVRLKPGTYQAYLSKNGNLPTNSQQPGIKFVINSNSTTQLYVN